MASDEKRSAVENVQRMFRAMMDDVTYYPNVERAKRDLEVSVEELRALRAENARLREALEKIASETAATWVCDTARAALGGRDE